jgi:arginase
MEARRRWAVVGVPIDSVGSSDEGSPFGTEMAPAALRELDLPARLGARDLGDLDVRITGADRDPTSGIRGWPSVGAVTGRVREGVRAVIADGESPFLLGGCCTMVMGAVAGARDQLGRVGIVNVDGHIDAYDNRTSPTGEAADMPVAALMGVGWGGLLAEMQPDPVVAFGDAFVIGARDMTEAADLGALPQRLGIVVHGAVAVRSDPEGAGRLAVHHFGQASTAPAYWAHLDVDILDEGVFPATDYLMPGGIDFDQLEAVLRPISEDPAMIGLSLGCYNPSKDPDGHCGQALASLLEDVLAGR